MYKADDSRYAKLEYKRCGRSGLMLPPISLGLWHNFGDGFPRENMQRILFTAFDNGITHFDLANNYGPPPGSAEVNLGRILKEDLSAYRDELIISSKAGYDMWPGPYGSWGSRKYLMASLDQSLKRMGIDYVDIFYSHRYDPDTPLEETMGALASAVKQGKALYAGISSYSAAKTIEAKNILNRMGVPLLIHQPSYSMLNRWIEEDLLTVLEQEGIGCIPFSPLAQGMLTDKYLNGIPDGSRATRAASFRKDSFLTEKNIEHVRKLNEIAKERGQTLAQMAIAWVARQPAVTSVLMGASSPEQLKDNLKALESPPFSKEELEQIDSFAVEGGVNIWSRSSEAG